MKKLLLFMSALLLMTACSKDEDNDDDSVPSTEPSWAGVPSKPHEMFERTVLVYISGENNLSKQIATELSELRQGSKGIGNNALVVYVDDANSRRNPYLLWIREGESVDSVTLDSDPYSSSPEAMSRILNLTSTYYPAQEYGLVLWGHASGWMIGDSIATSSSARIGSWDDDTVNSRRAFGVDNGENTTSVVGKWINMPTLANTLAHWKHLKFIFADCCQFQCIESAYELLGVCDYLIASPAEIPDRGAPYDTVTKGFFEKSEKFYETIVDSYFAQVVPWSLPWYEYNSRTPLSVIYMPEMLNLATATHEVLTHFVGEEYPDMSSLIYYMGNQNSSKESVMYDMNDFILKHTMRKSPATTADTAAYEKWKEVFDRTVIYKKNAKNGWASSGQVVPSMFQYLKDDARYGGVSMFVPQNRPNSWYEPYTSNGVAFDGYNKSIKQTAWYYAAHLNDFGW